MQYVDGFVLPVPKKNLKAYTALAKLACKVWLEHGALDYRECVAEDVKPGKLTSFPQSVKLKTGDRIVVQRAPHDALLIENPNAQEWRSLAEKLNWANSPQNQRKT